MPVRKNAEKRTVGNIIMNTPLQTVITKLVYILLLVAFLVIGYLFAKVEILQKGATAVVPTPQPAAPNGTAPQQPTPPDAKQVKKTLKMGHFPVEGNENAKITIVEFSDFECPFCGRFYSETLPQLKKEYIETGKVKLYYRHYPLPFHPKAVPLANLAECANDQDAFWKMHDKIFDNNSTVANMTDDQFKQWASDLGLDTTKFNNCYDNKQHQKEIDEDNAAGSAVGVSGTPTFYINGQQLVGAQPFASFKAVIDQELKK